MPCFIKKSPQVVKHVVKGEEWACSTLKAGKNKPVYDHLTNVKIFSRTLLKGIVQKIATHLNKLLVRMSRYWYNFTYLNQILYSTSILTRL